MAQRAYPAHGVPVRHACRWIALSLQEAYDRARHRAQRRQAREEMVPALFQTVRARPPRMEGVKATRSSGSS